MYIYIYGGVYFALYVGAGCTSTAEKTVKQMPERSHAKSQQLVVTEATVMQHSVTHTHTHMVTQHVDTHAVVTQNQPHKAWKTYPGRTHAVKHRRDEPLCNKS